ncbi:MAG: dTDP-4-dehydrorhamnose 3,5-epimerase [Bacteroidota bacterium]
MKFSQTSLRDAYIVTPEPFIDNRGFFARVFCKKEFSEIGHDSEFVQINHSMNTMKGTLRGLHYQIPPHAEVKLVRCIAGKVFDVIVDLRKDSETFLKSFGVELSDENMKMIYIPPGFAHGFQTLTDDAQLIYHHTDFYAPGFEGGISYQDPLLNISWPLPPVNLSERDKNHTFLTSDFKGIKL